MHALLIEDDASVRRSIELILKSEGYTCDSAASGEAGIALAKAGRHDVIILDLSLPDLVGHQVLRRLRAAKILTPVLILSGSDRREDKVKGLGIGADDYVTKPFDKAELVARVQAIVRRAKGPGQQLKAAALHGNMLARRGQAQPWSFKVAYAPPGETARRPAPASPPGDRTAADGRAPEATATDLSKIRIASPQSAAGPDAAGHPRRADLAAAGGSNLKVIVLGNAKGGTGKSTIAMHLIVALLRRGHRVGSLDLDAPQGTLSRYLDNRGRHAAKEKLELPMPEHHTIAAGPGDGAYFADALEHLAATCDCVVIDTPGHDNPLSRLAHGHADTLITPLNDSLIDLDMLALIDPDNLSVRQPSHYGALVLEARAAKAGAGGALDWIVLRNRLSALDARNKRNMSALLRDLATRLGFRIGPGLTERVVYRELFLSGLTLLDLREESLGAELSLSQVAARQELRELLKVVGALDPRQPPSREEAVALPRAAAS